MKPRKYSGTVCVDLGICGDQEIDYEVEYYPSTPDTRELPGDPAELYVLSAKNGVADLLPLLQYEGVFHDLILEQIREE